uniref:Lipase n=1 Tax=Panagrolaimus superbus TaxID=310955 RepID=A0A914YP63_9BILA
MFTAIKNTVSFYYSNGYELFQFNRPDLGSHASYGGKRDAFDVIKNKPVIFIHGNSDGALAIPGNYSSGWSYSIQYFLEKGYRISEMYATTWGDRNPENAKYRVHNCAYLLYVRNFINAVLGYTKADKIDIISHSMGVTMARAAVKGGIHYDRDGSSCDLGDPLTKRIETFLGISGANYGMCSCQGNASNIDPTCNSENGFWPGDACGANKLTCWDQPQPTECNTPIYSKFLTNLNNNSAEEADLIFSMWSMADDILANSCLVYDYPTPHIPNSHCVKIYFDLTHMQTKENTVKDQYRIIKNDSFRSLEYCSRSLIKKRN